MKKSREIFFNIQLNAGSDLVFKFSDDSQILEIRGVKNVNKKAIEKIHLSTFYRKPTKAKILNRTITTTRNFSINPDEALFKSFNMIFASDTNSIVRGNRKICAACLCILGHTITDKLFKQSPALALVFSVGADELVNPERIAWKYFIEKIVSSKSLPTDALVALIVDSEENRLEHINRKKETVHNDYYLPEQVQLLYATSDGGKEFLANKMIGTCDREAKMILNNILHQLEANEIDLSDIPGEEAPIVATRNINAF